MGKKKLDDPELRTRLMDAIRLGHGRHAACVAVGIRPETFTSYFKTNPDFRDEVNAALDASAEPVLAVLHELAQEGDVAAAKEWLKHNAPPPRSETDKGKIDVTVTHEVDASEISSIAELEARIQARADRKAIAAESEIVDAEVVDES